MRISIRSVLAVLAACVMAIAVAACGDDAGGSGGGGGTKSSDQAKKCGKDGKFLIGMSQANNAEPYRERMNEDIRTAAEGARSSRSSSPTRRRTMPSRCPTSRTS